tara:strand:+ start:1783 stop:2124 length:342 start_codon:yes stop_codon:yes gene_type:complete
MLEDYADSLDVREDADENIEVREHFVFVRYRKVHASTTWNPQVKESVRTLKYYVGNVARSKTIFGPSGSAKRYICSSDQVGPEGPGTPGQYLIQRQAWEHFGKWEAAPEGWEV